MKVDRDFASAAAHAAPALHEYEQDHEHGHDCQQQADEALGKREG